MLTRQTEFDRISKYRSKVPYQITVNGAGHVIDTATHPNQVTIDNWCETCIQELNIRAYKIDVAIANPNFGGVWAGGPTVELPPSWLTATLDEGTDTCHMETVDLPGGYTTGAAISCNAASENIYQQFAATSGYYYFFRLWMKVSANQGYFACTGLISEQMFGVSDWTRRVVCGRAPSTGNKTFQVGGRTFGLGGTLIATGVYIARNIGIPVILIGDDYAEYAATMFWGLDTGAGVIKIYVDDITAGANGKTIIKILALRDNRLTRSCKVRF